MLAALSLSAFHPSRSFPIVAVDDRHEGLKRVDYGRSRRARKVEPSLLDISQRNRCALVRQSEQHFPHSSIFP